MKQKNRVKNMRGYHIKVEKRLQFNLTVALIYIMSRERGGTVDNAACLRALLSAFKKQMPE